MASAICSGAIFFSVSQIAFLKRRHQGYSLYGADFLVVVNFRVLVVIMSIRCPACYTGCLDIHVIRPINIETQEG